MDGWKNWNSRQKCKKIIKQVEAELCQAQSKFIMLDLIILILSTLIISIDQLDCDQFNFDNFDFFE